jgi:dTDP-4-amino-4,6-dideoxy-D-galactose acyltransferase
MILPFDSKLFGYRVARLDRDLSPKKLGTALSRLRGEHVKLVYWFVDPKDEVKSRAAAANEGKMVDEKVTYVITLDSRSVERKGDLSLISYGKKEPDEELTTLALQSGQFSRFRIDKHFTHNEYEKLYTTWVRRSVARLIATDVLVCVDADRGIFGFVTMEMKGGMGSIGLLVVDERSRGKSIGKALVEAVLARFKKLGHRRVFVTTQKKNVIACKFYEKLGFVLYKQENVYHFWL